MGLHRGVGSGDAGVDPGQSRGGTEQKLLGHAHLVISVGERFGEDVQVGVLAQISRHADRGGEPGLAYRFALIASDASVRRFAFEEALTWLDLAATSARSKAETDAVNRLTAEVLEVAGWSEAPAGPRRMPITRELVTEDLDLRVRG